MRFVFPQDGPPTGGPYSPAVVNDAGLVHVSGQVGLSAETGALVGGGATEEAAVAFANLVQALQAAGSGVEHVLRVGVYLTDVGDFAAINAVFAETFGDHRPARTTIVVAGLPLGAAVEVDCVAEVARA